jgi:hypothetical protein
MRHTQLENFIHRFRSSYALHHGVHRLIQQRHQHAVGDKSRGIVHFDWGLLKLRRQVPNDGEGCIRSRQPSNHFHQFHDWDRVEEVHTDHFVRPLG